MKFETNIFDIAKTVAVIALVLFLFVHVPNMFAGWYDSKSNLNHTIIENIAKNVAMATVVESNKELRRVIKVLEGQDSKALQAMRDIKAEVKEVGRIQADLRGEVKEYAKGTYFRDEERDGARDLADTIVMFEDSNENEYPVATVYYSPNLPKIEDRWTVAPHNLKFNANIILAQQEDGTYKRVVEAWIENHYSSLGKDSAGNYKKFPVDLQILDWAKKKERSKKFMFNPRIGVSSVVGDEVYPNLGISLFSYGRTKRDMDWRFLEIGVGGTTDTLYFGASPASYNIGNMLPLIENVFMGPYIGLSDSTETIYGVGFSVPF